MPKVHLLVIDPQNSFCNPNGSLYVKGADEDMNRLAKMVKRLAGKLDDIHVTMDSHRKVDISHPIWFVDKESGKRPEPFTIMSLVGNPSKGRTLDGQIVDVPGDRIMGKNVFTGLEREYTARLPSELAYTKYYLAELYRLGRYPHIIWPEHCLIGDEGHNIWPNLSEAMHEWEERFAMVDFVTKGSNPHTEHFSGLQAEVPDPTDPTTQLATGLIRTLEEADIILVAGEALSHCLKFTVSDLAANFSNSKYIQKMILLTDASSSVTTFEQNGQDFIKEMVAKGMQTSTTVDFLA